MTRKKPKAVKAWALIDTERGEFLELSLIRKDLTGYKLLNDENRVVSKLVSGTFTITGAK